MFCANADFVESRAMRTQHWVDDINSGQSAVDNTGKLFFSFQS